MSEENLKKNNGNKFNKIESVFLTKKLFKKPWKTKYKKEIIEEEKTNEIKKNIS